MESPPPYVDELLNEAGADENDMPGNVSFEEIEDAEEQVSDALAQKARETLSSLIYLADVLWAARLHAKPSRLTEPVILPLSSLASTAPTLPAPSVSLTRAIFSGADKCRTGSRCRSSS